MTYDLWPSSITSNYHLSPITVTHDYPWPWLITCHSWLIHNHDWSHMIIAHDYQGLSPMTIIHDYEHHRWLCPSHDLPQLTMTITHDHDCYPWLWISLTIYHHTWLVLHHSWLSPLCVTYDSHRSLITRDDHLSPMTLITQDHHQWPSLPFTTHDYDFLLTTSTRVLSSIPYHSCLVSHVLSLMSYHPCLVSHVYLWPWLMTIMPYDLQLITRDYHSRPSSMTITHDHQVWSLDFSPLTSHTWLLRSSHQWPWLTIGDFPSYDHHPWAWHTPYHHDFSPMTSHPTTMTTLWPWSVLNDRQDTHPMTIRMVTNVHFGSLLWSAHMDYLMGEYDVHYDRHIYFDRHIHCAWGEYERVWENESVISSH